MAEKTGKLEKPPVNPETPPPSPPEEPGETPPAPPAPEQPEEVMVPLSKVQEMIDAALKNQPAPVVTMEAAIAMAAKTGKDEKKRESIEEALKRDAEAIRNQKRVKIKINATENKRDDVSVIVNGVHFVIKRDEFVEVPECVIHALNNAKIQGYVQRKREDGEGNELVPFTSMRFSYQTATD